MRRLLRTAFLAAILPLALAASAQAQFNDINPGDLDELGEALSVVGDQYADAYVQPVTDAFGAGMNAALFRTADGEGGLVPMVDVYVGVAFTGALMASSDKSFLPQDETVVVDGTEFDVNYVDGTGGQPSVPTAFGSTNTPDGQILIEQNGVEVARAQLPPGLADTPVAPLPIPQLGVGTLFGTDAQLRFLPKTRIKSYGTVSLFGVAMRHSISQYLPLSPVSIAVQGAWNQITLEDRTIEGDVLDASGWAANLQVSKSFLVATLYGGLQYESFGVDYSYRFNPTGNGLLGGGEPIPVTVSQDASNTVRGLLGVTGNVGPVRINADYALSANDVLTLGLGVKL